jgi:hypothetical protein
MTSPGEVLWYELRTRFLRDTKLAHSAQTEEQDWADPKGRLRRYCEDSVVSTTCARLVGQARRHLDLVLPNNVAANTDLFRQHTVDQIKQFCVDPLGMSFVDRSIDRLGHLAFDAAIAARQEISETSRNETFRDSARCNSGSIICYLCSVKMGAWQVVRETRGVALDHLWPKAFGGRSKEENLLPICDVCNGLKKDRITWDVYGPVHDYALRRHSPDGVPLTKIALHRRAAVKLAEEDHTTLKEAFQALGSYKDLQTAHPDETEWFFNQFAHNTDVLEELW